MKNLFLKGVLAFTLFSSTVFAQNNSRLKEVANEFTYDSNNQINFIKLKSEYSVYETEAENFLNSVVLNSSNSTVKKVKSEKDNLGFTHTKYQVLYNNTPVKNAIIMLHAQNGKVVSVNGDLGQIQKPVNTVAINEQKGLQQALNKIKAEVYKWENKVEENHMKEVYNNPSFSYYPKGELVLYAVASRNQKSEMHYAYKFNIYAEKPLYRANVIVDAQTGSVLAEENLICHADVPGTAKIGRAHV